MHVSFCRWEYVIKVVYYNPFIIINEKDIFKNVKYIIICLSTYLCILSTLH